MNYRKRSIVPKHFLERFKKYKAHRDSSFDSKGFTVDTSLVQQDLDSLEGEYKERVNKLIGQLLDYAKSDSIDPLKPSSYSYEGFDVPHNTHEIVRLATSISTTWSKDIDDKNNRLCYQIRTKTIDGVPDKRIVVLQIKNHSDILEERYESRTFSAYERSSALEQWEKKHEKLPKFLRDKIRPLYLTDAKVSPLTPTQLKASEQAYNLLYKQKESIPQVPPLTVLELRKNGILGDLV